MPEPSAKSYAVRGTPAANSIRVTAACPSAIEPLPASRPTRRSSSSAQTFWLTLLVIVAVSINGGAVSRASAAVSTGRATPTRPRRAGSSPASSGR